MSFSSIDLLEENSEEVFIKVTSILMKLVENVLKNPTDQKYRKIRLENATISKYVLPSVGGMECLFDVGFVEGDDSLILPNSTSLDKLKSFRQALINKKNELLNNNGYKKNKLNPSSSKSPIPSTSSDSNQHKLAEDNQSSKISRKLPSLTSAQHFIQSMESNCDLVYQYEDVELQLQALSLIPVLEIESNTMKQVREIQKSSLKEGVFDVCESSIFEIIYLKELMKWFKTKFFKWVDSPPCSLCNSRTEFKGHSSDANELKYTNRVEVYSCKNCNKRELFPRYNDARLLLETRRGRCGEWGQCFTLICRALKWDARYISDSTDHVWTEVYSHLQKRWLHCDPCECVIDKPLLYEKGWNKKLSYIIAYSCDGVYDVAWRYSSDHLGLRSRRNVVSEVALLQHMMKLTNDRRKSFSEKRIKYLNRRHVKELVDFLLPPTDNTDETLQGRTSGSLAWRLARGELSSSSESSFSHIWIPSPKEISSKKMVLSYCSSKDEYYNGFGERLLNGWNKGVYQSQNIFRKEELDWKNVYLCRIQGSSSGSIIWKFDFRSSGMVIDSISINILITTFKTGIVNLVLCGGNNCILVKQGNGGFISKDFEGETEISLKAELKGGEGDVAWQHAQLFRKAIDSVDEIHPFCVTITLKNK